jgi:uncharacterized surface protein with fasciclin (FAS1) repeats
MLMRFKKRVLFLGLIVVFAFSGCKKWDDTEKLFNQDLSKTLMELIAADPNLSTFNTYLKTTGVDLILASSKTFTVWAPSNAALTGLDPTIVSDPVKLKNFVLNHISNQSYFTKDVAVSIRVPMLSGKYNNFFKAKIEDANISAADKYVSNGVLHVIDKALPVLPNVWEYINSTTATYLQNSFIAGLNFQQFDPSLATIDSISVLTALPVYHPGTGFVTKNQFNVKVSDLQREDKQYTYFVIANTGFTTAVNALKPYYAAGTPAITDSLAKWNVVKDLIVDTLYPNAASLPATLTSKFGIPIPIIQSAITQTIKVSNGIVYVLNSSAITTASKFPSIIFEGENPDGFSRTDKRSSTHYRVRVNPVTGLQYSDLLVSGTGGLGTLHGVTGFYAYYRLNEAPSMKYNVYGVAVNDFQTTAVFQSVSVNYLTPPATYSVVPVSSVLLPAVTTQFAWTVPASSVAGAYNEVLLGTFTTNQYGILEFRLTSGGTTLGSAGAGSIVMDYLRIVPVP